MPDGTIGDVFDEFMLKVFGIDMRTPARHAPLSEAEYKAWQKAHPKAGGNRVGPWMGEPIYKQYTAEYFTSKGFYLAGKMRMGSSGEYDEVWLKDDGDGTEDRVLRIPPSAQPPPPPDEEEEDVREAEQLPKDRAFERDQVIKKMHELVQQPPGDDYDRMLDEYDDMETKWIEHLADDTARCNTLRNKAKREASKQRIQAALDKLSALYHNFPDGDEWQGRDQVPLPTP
ncbi:MAG: hypothetical protein JOZ05_07360 [Acetobacteraceae bacterium]|nr:hypothetical protein [Acetobacteraceae bacterium]